MVDVTIQLVGTSLDAQLIHMVLANIYGARNV